MAAVSLSTLLSKEPPMRHLILLTLISCCCFAADPSPAVPPEVAKIVAEHDAVVAKAKAAFDAACVKADQDAAKKLEPVVVKLTKAGDLKGATAGQAVLEGWKGGEAEQNNDPKVAAVVGKWKRGAATVTINADGSFVDSRSIGGKWAMNKDGSFVMTWGDSGIAVTCSKPIKNTSLENGGPSQLTKLLE